MPLCELVTLPQASLRGRQTDTFIYKSKTAVPKTSVVAVIYKDRDVQRQTYMNSFKDAPQPPYCHLQALRMVMLSLAENAARKQADFSKLNS